MTDIREGTAAYIEVNYPEEWKKLMELVPIISVAINALALASSESYAGISLSLNLGESAESKYLLSLIEEVLSEENKWYAPTVLPYLGFLGAPKKTNT